MSQGVGFDVFLTDEAARINRARLDHLVSLGLNLAGKRVLEVGGGVGLMTQPFEDAKCRILSTDGAPANVAEMRRRHPGRDCMALDIDAPGDFSALGRFDLIFCYGTLYHLAEPERALAQLAEICDGQILLETIVLPGDGAFLQQVEEPLIANQAIGGIGCRPSRGWVMDTLERLFGHAYTTLDQPDYPDFVDDWRVIAHGGNLRAVFVGSKVPMDNPNLTPQLPERHRSASARRGSGRKVWLDIAAGQRDRGLAEARADDTIELHVFEPQAALAAELADDAPPNVHVHAAGIAVKDGVAPGKVPFQALRLESALARIRADAVDRLRMAGGPDTLETLRTLGEHVTDVKRIEIAGAKNPARIAAALAEHGFEPVRGEAAKTTLVVERPGATPKADAGALPFEHFYDLARLRPMHGGVTTTGGDVVVTTDDRPWAYAAVLAPAAGASDDLRPVTLRLWVEAEDAPIEIAVSDESGADLIARTIVTPGPGRACSLALPAGVVRGQLVVRNAGDPGPARVRLRATDAAFTPEASQDARFAYDERREFEAVPAGWEDPFALLRKKWSEIPASYEERQQSERMLDLSDQDLLDYWRKSFEDQTLGEGYNIRGWYHDLYRDLVPGKRILDVGCGIGTSSIAFAEQGAHLVFADIVESNLRLVERICRLKEIEAEYHLIEDYASYDALPYGFDIIMAIGSLINAPHGVTRREIARLVPHLKTGGRWLHLAYPRARWEREGRMPFSRWGEKTDGVGTPWMVYQNRAEILALFDPTPVRICFDCEWKDSEFNWFDLEVG